MAPEPSLADLAAALRAGHPAARVLHALVSHPDDPALVEALGPQLALVRFLKSARMGLIIFSPQPPLSAVADVVRACAPSGLEVCVITDDPAQATRVREALPPALPRPVAVSQVDGAGVVKAWLSPPLGPGPLARVLSAGLPAAVTEADWARLDAAYAERLRRWHAVVAGATGFSARLRQGRAPATRVLMAAVVAIFALELLLSSATPVWALRRLGALDVNLLLSGEWWRLSSCMFLHGGLMHVAFNGMVLWGLGASIEKLLGNTRFLTLFALSGALGGLLSAARMPAGMVSVGASGALWGLLCAQAALVLDGKSPLPQAIRAHLRQGVLTNLLINGAVSFVPHVDWAAHLGGGVCGALLVAVMVRVERWDAGAPPSPTSWPWRAAALAAMVFLAGGLGLALARADLPALLNRGQAVRSLPEAGLLRVEVPGPLSRLPARPVQADERQSCAALGQIASDPAVMQVCVMRATPPLTAPEQERLAQEVARAWGKGEPATPALETVSAAEGVRLMRSRALLGNGVSVDRAVRVGAEGTVMVEVVSWPGEDHWPDAAVSAARNAALAPASGSAAP